MRNTAPEQKLAVERRRRRTTGDRQSAGARQNSRNKIDAASEPGPTSAGRIRARGDNRLVEGSLAVPGSIGDDEEAAVNEPLRSCFFGMFFRKYLAPPKPAGAADGWAGPRLGQNLTIALGRRRPSGTQGSGVGCPTRHSALKPFGSSLATV